MKGKVEISAAALFLWALAILLIPLKWAFALLVAAAIHEGAHLLALWAMDIPIGGMRITPGGMKLSVDPMNPVCELIAAAAGPLGSLLLMSLANRFPELALCGLIQGIYNLIPVMESDGSRILECGCIMIFPARGKRIADRIRRVLVSWTALGAVFLIFLVPQFASVLILMISVLLAPQIENLLAKKSHKRYNSYNYVLRGNRHDKLIAQNPACRAETCPVHRRRI